MHSHFLHQTAQQYISLAIHNCHKYFVLSDHSKWNVLYWLLWTMETRKKRSSIDRIKQKFEFITFSDASGLSGFLSGWYFRANFLYVFLTSSGVAVFGKPSVSYNVSPEVLRQKKKTKLYQKTFNHLRHLSSLMLSNIY